MTATGMIHAKCEKLNGDPAAGSILVKANTTDGQVRDPIGNVVFSGPMTVQLVNGEATFTLPATDAGSLSPTGFTYTAVEQLKHVARDDYRTVEFALTTAQTLQLADVAANTEISETPSWAADLNGVLARLSALEAGGGMGVDPEEDIVLTGPGKGLVVVSPDGTITIRISVDDTGEITREIIEGEPPPEPGDPTDVPGLLAWFKTSDLDLENGDSVVTWTDSVGAYALESGPGISNSPLFATTGINGLPAVHFVQASDQRMRGPATLNDTKPFTLFYVLKAADFANFAYLMTSSDGGGAGIALRLNQTTGYPNLDKTATASMGTATAGPSVNVGGVIVVTYDGTGHLEFRVNGEAVGSVTNDQTFETPGALEMGSGFNGYVGEWGMYSAALAGDDLDLLEAYLIDAWNIA